jgi:hypothetical protein
MRWVRRVILAVCVVATAAIVLLDVRSGWRWDWVGVGLDSDRSYSVRSAAHRLGFRVRSGPNHETPLRRYGMIGYIPEPPRSTATDYHDLTESGFFDEVVFLQNNGFWRTTDEKWMGIGWVRANDDPPFRARRRRSRDPGFVTTHYVAVDVPHGYAAGVAGTLPAVAALRAAWRWRRRRLGLCAACGYDVRCSGEVCPECGTAVKCRVGATGHC